MTYSSISSLYFCYGWAKSFLYFTWHLWRFTSLICAILSTLLWHLLIVTWHTSNEIFNFSDGSCTEVSLKSVVFVQVTSSLISVPSLHVDIKLSLQALVCEEVSVLQSSDDCCLVGLVSLRQAKVSNWHDVAVWHFAVAVDDEVSPTDAFDHSSRR